MEQTQLVLAAAALGVTVIFAAGLWLAIFMEAERKREQDEKRRRQ